MHRGPLIALRRPARGLRLLRVEQHERDEHDDDDQELQEAHADEQVPAGRYRALRAPWKRWSANVADFTE